MIGLADSVAATMFAAIMLYALFGGADFGSGTWDLLAGGPRKGASTRRLIDHAIGPVWEANHVWLIFVLVFLWSAFPAAFGTLMRTLSVPFWFVGLGVLLRAGGFAFRKFAPTMRVAQAAGATFALSSVLTPFFLGAIAGAVASGRAAPDAGGDGVRWLSTLSIYGGVMAVLTCTFLAGVFLTAEAHRADEPELADRLRIRTLGVGVLNGTLALFGYFPLRHDAPVLAEGLTGRAVIFVITSAIAGGLALWFLHTKRLKRARIAAVVAVGSIVAGWGVAQYPWILVDHLTIEEAAGSSATLIGLLVATGLAAVLVVPALTYLYILADSNRLGTSGGTDSK